jgi:DNA-binding beta-propeller fold protein YncE
MKYFSVISLLVLLAISAVDIPAAEVQPVPRDERKSPDAKITSGPKVSRAAGKTKITFAVSAAVDVEIAILDARGTVVRHLAAGLLGPAAPKPFKKNSLKQEIVWDGTNDQGQKASGAAKVRLRIGMKHKFEKYLGWNGLTFDQNIVGIAVGKNGEVYIAETEKSWGRSMIRVISKEGKYLRTILPFSNKTPLARRKEFGVHKMPNGLEVPFVFNAQNGCTQPLVSALRNQDIVVHPDGHLLLTSANGSLSNHGPAQYLLAMHPDGGVPEKIGYLGPEVRDMKGFLGGAGNSTSTVYNGLALSPDAKYIYRAGFTDGWRYKYKNEVVMHGVRRLQWGDKKFGKHFLGNDKPGSDDQHFKNVAGLATDSAGNIYVCDNGNGRLMIFSPAAKLLHKVEVPNPYQVRVHPKSGDIYLLCRELKRYSLLKSSKLMKFTPVSKGKPVSVGEFATGRRVYKYIALDATSTPARLYTVQHGGWRRQDKILLIANKGKSFEIVRQINNNNGLSYPLFVAADPKRGRAFVRNFLGGMSVLDLNSGKMKKCAISGSNEIEINATGDIYSISGWSWKLSRYTSQVKHKPFAAGTNKGAIGGPFPMGKDAKGKKLEARAKGFGQGGRGIAIGPDGNLYLLKMPQYTHGWVDVYSPEGKLLKEKLIDNLPYSSGGIGVDAAGNIYIGVSLRPETGKKYFPRGFETAPHDKWVWYKKKRPLPWDMVYYNTYLFYYGSVIKFSPKGGRFRVWNAKGKNNARPADVPEKWPTYRSGYLREKIAVDGAQWLFNGCSPIPTSGENWGDPSCSCWNIRLRVDPYGRVFIPDCFRFAIHVTDTAGNLINRMGRYGNVDDISKGSDIVFGWPAYTSLAGDKLYVSDVNTNRLLVINLEYAASASCSIK